MKLTVSEFIAKVLLPVALGVFANGCAAEIPSTLMLARVSYDAAASSPAATVAPSYLAEARASLDKANQEFATKGDTGICRDYAYLVQNEVESAESAARAEMNRRALEAAASSDPHHAEAPSPPMTVASH